MAPAKRGAWGEGAPRRAPTLVLALASVLLFSTSPVQGQSGLPVAARAVPDTVTVGDRFTAVARVSLPADASVEVDSVLPSDTSAVQLAGKPVVHRPDSARSEHVVAIPLVAWKTGRAPAVAAALRVREGGATRTVRIALRLPFVRSVLPADTARVRPRPPKDVLDPPRDWRALALLGAAALLAALLLFFLTRALVRRMRRPRAITPADARREALAALERARKSGMIERGEWQEFYALVSDALRGFAAALSPGWGRELTTGEVAARMAADGVGEGEVEAFASVLASADLAKFARFQFTPGEAERDLDAARAWVEGFDPASLRPPVASGIEAEGSEGEGEAREAEEVAR